MKKENNQLTSSRKVGMRDINALLSAPISRIKTLRDDEGRSIVEDPEQKRLRMTPCFNSPLIRATPTFPLMGKSSSPWRERMPVGQVRGAGFTLIELLVVVLIIGILAAIALPQYQKAIMKSRFSTLKPIAKSVKDAQEIYYMRNGQYATQAQLADLDVGVPANAGITISDTAKHDFVRATHTGLPHNSYVAYLDHSENFAGNIYCEACDGDENATALCAAEGGKDGIANGNCTLYLLSGNGTGSFTSPGKTITSAVTGACSFWVPEGNCTTYTYADGTSVEHLSSGAVAGAVSHVYNAQGEDVATLAWNGGFCESTNGSSYCEDNSFVPQETLFCDMFPEICAYQS